MFRKINELQLFFEDSYREIGVREYSRLVAIAPATSSKLLRQYEKEGLLSSYKDKGYLLFRAKLSKEFIALSRIYFYNKFKLIGLIDKISKFYSYPTIVLFGSFSKAEIRKKSDIDLVVFTSTKKKIDLGKFEKELGREIHLFLFKDIDSVSNKLLKLNIFNGFLLSERWY